LNILRVPLAASFLGTLLVFGTLAPASAFAADSDDADSAGGIENRPAHARLSFERVKFPGNERVGLVGTSYLVDVSDSGGWSVGPAVYGAMTGQRGGFFTFGGEAAWHQRLLGPLGVELGLYAGGGGGSGAPQGGGLMLRPHADLLWELGSYALALSVAKVKFPNGQIDSTQWGLALDMATDFNFVAARRLDTPALAGSRTGMGFDRLQIVGGIYRTRSGALLNDGTALPRDIQTLGVRAEQAWGRNAYWGLEASGAAQSGVAGYAEYLANFGLEGEAIRDHLNVGARVALGMAGGGSIPVGGGLIVKAAVYGVVRLSNDLGISIEAGVASAPQGGFRAASLSAAMVWALDSPEGGGLPARPVRTDFSAGVEQFNAARRDGSTRVLHADVLKVDRFLSPNFYVSGQVHSAVSGGAGGYSEALIGAGWMQPLAWRWHVGAELLAGAAGGGGIDSHGSIFEPMAYAGFQLTPAVALRVGAGRVKALRGPLGANVVNALLTVTYGVSGGG
jgi:hypothetical protein